MVYIKEIKGENRLSIKEQENIKDNLTTKIQLVLNKRMMEQGYITKSMHDNVYNTLIARLTDAP